MIQVLDVAIYSLMWGIVICAFMQQSTSRKIVASAFAFGIIAHDWIFHALSDDPYLYYLSAAAFDLMVIVVISKLHRLPRLATDIQIIALISIVFNLVGWAQYEQGYDGAAYMMMYAILYAWAIVAMLRTEVANDGENEADPCGHPFHINDSAWHIFNPNHQRKKWRSQ